MSDDSFGAVYLALLLILPMSALVARRLPIAATLKLALAWVAVFGMLFVLIALWQSATGTGSMPGAHSNEPRYI